MKRGSKFLVMGSALFGVVLFTVIVIYGYNHPNAANRRKRHAPSASPMLTRQMLDQSARLLSERRYMEAEHLLNRILSVDPDNLTAQKMLGNVYFMAERYYDAVNIFRAILTRYPQDPVMRNNLGLSLINIQWHEAGIRELLTARAINPAQPEIDLNLSRAYEGLGDTQKAVYYRALAERMMQQPSEDEQPQADIPAESSESK